MKLSDLVFFQVWGNSTSGATGTQYANPSQLINYVSEWKKIIVGRNNNTVSQKFKIDNRIKEFYYFQVINKINQIVALDDDEQYEFYGSFIDAKGEMHTLFYSDDFAISQSNVLRFRVNTYTSEYLYYVKNPRQIDLTIKLKNGNGQFETVILRDTGIAYPTPIEPGMEPTPVIAGFGLDINGFLISLTGTVLSGDNSTITINDNVISYIGPSGITYIAGEGIGISDQNVISLTATIPSSITQLDGTANLIRTISEQNSISAYYLNSVPEGGCTWKVGIDYDSLHNAGFAYTSAIPSSMEQLDDHTRYLTAIVPQNALTSIHYGLSQQKVGINYTLLHNAGFAYTSAIPTSTSQLTNDSGFITGATVGIFVDGDTRDYFDINGMDFSQYFNQSEAQISLNVNTIFSDMQTNGCLDNYALTSQIPLSTSQLVDNSGFGHSNVLRVYVGGQQDNSYSCPWSSQYDCFSYWTYGSGGTIQINKMSNVTLNNDDCTTFEFWVLDLGSCTNITFENGITVIGDMPTTFPAGKRHVFVRRIVKQWGSNTEYISYAYSV